MARTLQEPQSGSEQPTDDASPGLLGLLGLLLLGAASAVLLWQLDGRPRVTTRPPDWSYLRDALSGTTLTDTDLITAAATIAWLVLAYLALTVALRLVLTLIERLSGGARWAGTALRLSNLVTLPAVRRVVDGGVAGTLLLASWAPVARPTFATEVAPASVAFSPRHAAASQAGPEPTVIRSPAQQTQEFIEYTVVPGDYLWDIARRLYGDGSRFVEIFDANRGRVMPGGEAFTDPRVIRPGWVLRVPLPATNLHVEDGAASYRVRRGDHLWGIAERLLGDGFRWVEIWELNRDHDMGAGRRFTDPNLIYPGWLIDLPLEVTEVSSPPVAAAPPAPTATPVAAVEPPPATTPASTYAEPDRGAPDEDVADGGWGWDWPVLPRSVLVTAGGFVVLGGTALFVQRMHRAGRLPRRRGDGSTVAGTGDAGRVALATRALSSALADAGFATGVPLLVREAGRKLEFTVSCPGADAEELVALRHDLARRLACDVEAATLGSSRVVLTLSGFQRLAAMLTDESGAPAAPAALMVPVGADADGVVYLNLAAAGSVAVAGAPGERRQLLRSWIATLSTISSPEEVSIRVESEAARLLAIDEALPHLAGSGVETDATDLADELDELIQSRGATGSIHPLVALVDFPDQANDLFDAALRHGPAVGLVLICGLQPGPPTDRSGAFGASITFGASNDPGDEEDRLQDPTALILTFGRDEPLVLAPVHVRRDTSTRWTESAEVATFERPFLRTSVHVPEPHAPAAEARAEATEVDSAQNGATASADPAPVLESLTDDLPEGEDGTQAPPTAVQTAEAEPTEASVTRDDERDEAAATPLARDENAASTVPGENTATAITRFTSAGEPESPLVPDHLPTTARQPALLLPSDPDGAQAAAAPELSTFVVRCLGRFEVWLGDERISGWRLEKSRELIAFLATQGGNAVPRETVADALWSGYGWDASVRHLIANAVSGVRARVRAAADNDSLQPLLTARQRMQLHPTLFWIDLDAFESSLRQAASLPDREALEAYERALALYRGDFLEGELFPWIDAYRADFRQRLIEGARRAAGVADQLGEHARADRLYCTILEHEPTDEPAARWRMRYLARAGDINGARKVYRALTEALQLTLDDPRARPAPETQSLLTELALTAQGLD